MLNKLHNIKEEYEGINIELSSPEVMADSVAYQKKMIRHSEIAPIFHKYEKYLAAVKAVEEAKEILATDTDPEMKTMAEHEIIENTEKIAKMDEELKLMLIPTDANDKKNVIIEIRAGTGGEEASLFCADLYKMYSRYAEKIGFKLDLMESSPTNLGGLKEVIFMINGNNAYAKFKYESGAHRVQRVPATEASGRIHTSAVTVAVLPEQEEFDVQINPSDLRIDTFCASGPGGQGVNTTYSAVRIVHLPTGTEVQCQDERSQIKNKAKAMTILRARIVQKLTAIEDAKLAKTRKDQVGSGDRSEKIRTYNFPQNRVTDHRIGMSIHNLTAFMEGDIGDMLDALIKDGQQRRLSEAAK